MPCRAVAVPLQRTSTRADSELTASESHATVVLLLQHEVLQHNSDRQMIGSLCPERQRSSPHLSHLIVANDMSVHSAQRGRREEHEVKRLHDVGHCKRELW